MNFNIENRRYTGSKSKLFDWIQSLIQENCTGTSFADLFAGTGVVACKMSKYYDRLIVNDVLHSNNLIYKAFFIDSVWNKEKLNIIKEKYNNLKTKEIEENYFSKNFGNKFFDKDDAKIIGFIRDDLEIQKNELNEKEYNILLASLIYSTDKISNTVGHYDAYFKNKKLEPKFKLNLIEPLNIKNIKIYQEDANILAKSIKTDIVYIDPPYNSRQYSRFYHLLENLTQWKQPKLYGTALKPEPENISDYCKSNAPQVFADLIKSLDCSYIAVSYNNTYNSKSNSSKNKITLDEIKRILSSKGETKIYECNHRYFNSGKTEFKDHKEFLFITKAS